MKHAIPFGADAERAEFFLAHMLSWHRGVKREDMIAILKKMAETLDAHILAKIAVNTPRYVDGGGTEEINARIADEKFLYFCDIGDDICQLFLDTAKKQGSFISLTGYMPRYGRVTESGYCTSYVGQYIQNFRAEFITHNQKNEIDLAYACIAGSGDHADFTSEWAEPEL